MKMSLVVDGLHADVESVAALGDEVVAEVAERIGAVLARSAPSRILELLSEGANELTDDLPEGRVEIRLIGDDIAFVYLDAPHPTPEGDAELSARITLRLPEQLKTRVEEAAARQGASTNAWIVRTLERGASSAQARHGKGGNRLQGYGKS